MISRFYTLLISFLLTYSTLNLSAQGYGVVIDSTIVASGQTICVPVRALGFTEIASFQYVLHWNEQVLQFDHVEPGHLPSSPDANFFFPSLANTLLVGWSDYDGIGQTIPDDSVLYNVCFLAVGAEGSNTLVYADGNGFAPGNGSAEAYNISVQDVWDATLNVPGLVEVAAPLNLLPTSAPGSDALSHLQLLPNPTCAATQVLWESNAAGKGTLSLYDPAGRLVYTQKIEVKAGENRFEIPANILNTKGIYQVSLQTAGGVNTQLLSVH